jgi:hypothetical protein
LKYVRARNAFVNYGRGAYFFAGAPIFFQQPYLFIQGLAPTQASAVADPRAMAGFGFVQDDWRRRRRAPSQIRGPWRVSASCRTIGASAAD